MKRDKKRITIVFTEDYAGKKSGESFQCDSMLARELVTKEVAIYQAGNDVTEVKTVTKETKVNNTKTKKNEKTP